MSSRPRVIPERPVLVAGEGVARQVPPVDDIGALLGLVVEIAAAPSARAPARRPDDAGRDRPHLFVDDHRAVLRERHAQRAGLGAALGRGDEHMQHLGRAQKVADFKAGSRAPSLEDGSRQMLARRAAQSQRRKIPVAEQRQQRAIEGSARSSTS